MAGLRRAVFLDRDGTLMDDAGYVRDPALVRIFPGVPDALGRLQRAGFCNVIVTNQSGIGRGFFTVEDFTKVQARFLELVGVEKIAATYFCPDHPERASDRRKPAPGMLLEAARDLGLDLSGSWMIGDRRADVEAGQAAGTRAVLVRTGEGAHAEAPGADFVGKDFAAAVDFILEAGDARR